MPALADELLRDASQSCRIEGDDLIVEHCYIERRLRPLNLFLRKAEPAAAEAAIIDYGNALRDLAASNVFPGDLLLKNRAFADAILQCQRGHKVHFGTQYVRKAVFQPNSVQQRILASGVEVGDEINI